MSIFSGCAVYLLIFTHEKPLFMGNSLIRGLRICILGGIERSFVEGIPAARKDVVAQGQWRKDVMAQRKSAKRTDSA